MNLEKRLLRRNVIHNQNNETGSARFYPNIVVIISVFLEAILTRGSGVRETKAFLVRCDINPVIGEGTDKHKD